VRPREVVLALVRAFNDRDIETLAGFYRADAVNVQVAESPMF
jgi:ketosteroid isomerase-like protein